MPTPQTENRVSEMQRLHGGLVEASFAAQKEREAAYYREQWEAERADLAEMRGENERLKKDIEKKDQELMDHAEDWAFCGINPNSETAKKLVLHYHKREQERIELRDLRGKADGLAGALELIGKTYESSPVKTYQEMERIASDALKEYRAALGSATQSSES